VAGPAIGEAGALDRALGLLAAVAVHAPAHVQGRDLPDDVHLLDRPVALPARDAVRDVAMVPERHVVRDAMDPVPLDRRVHAQPRDAKTFEGGAAIGRAYLYDPSANQWTALDAPAESFFQNTITERSLS
jgi:hypothetical protein